MKQNFFKACLNRLQKIDSRVIPRAATDECCKYACWNWPSVHQKETIPKDVPKGHFVVYVGEYQKRFVIKIGLLKHPLFKALLDRTQEVYDLGADSKFWIPCDEELFISIVRCATSSRGSYISICICWYDATCSPCRILYPIVTKFIILTPSSPPLVVHDQLLWKWEKFNHSFELLIIVKTYHE